MRKMCAWNAALAACLAVAGCVEERPNVTSSTEEALVKGQVTVLGKPATGGHVTFDPTNVNRPNARQRTVQIRPDGGYEATTLVGPNSVSVNVDEPRTKAETSGDFGLDVKPGVNAFDVALPRADE